MVPLHHIQFGLWALLCGLQQQKQQICVTINNRNLPHSVLEAEEYKIKADCVGLRRTDFLTRRQCFPAGPSHGGRDWLALWGLFQAPLLSRSARPLPEKKHHHGEHTCITWTGTQWSSIHQGKLLYRSTIQMSPFRWRTRWETQGKDCEEQNVANKKNMLIQLEKNRDRNESHAGKYRIC